MKRLNYEEFLEKMIEKMDADVLLDLVNDELKECVIKKNTEDNIYLFVKDNISMFALLEQAYREEYSTYDDYFIFKKETNCIDSFDFNNMLNIVLNEINMKDIVKKIKNSEYYKNKYQHYLKKIEATEKAEQELANIF